MVKTLLFDPRDWLKSYSGSNKSTRTLIDKWELPKAVCTLKRNMLIVYVLLYLLIDFIMIYLRQIYEVFSHEKLMNYVVVSANVSSSKKVHNSRNLQGFFP